MINISKNGLRTKYSDLFDEKSIGVLPKYITDHGMIECNDKIIEVTNLNHVSKNLYQQIGNHPVFRFLSKDIPDIYFQCTLSHPYAKEYSVMILGTASRVARTWYIPRYFLGLVWYSQKTMVWYRYTYLNHTFPDRAKFVPNLGMV